MCFILHFLQKKKILVYCMLPRKDQNSWLPTVIILFLFKTTNNGSYSPTTGSDKNNCDITSSITTTVESQTPKSNQLLRYFNLSRVWILMLIVKFIALTKLWRRIDGQPVSIMPLQHLEETYINPRLHLQFTATCSVHEVTHRNRLSIM